MSSSSELKNPSAKYLHHPTPNGAKTILITNNYTQNGGVSTTSGSGSGKNGSATNSITILTTAADRADPEANTVVLDRINICINNHYDSSGSQPVVNIKAEKISEDPSSYGMMPPAAATSKFKQGEDVLVQQKDGRFYLGTVVLATANQCLVQFDDNTQKWASHSDLKRFGTSKVDDDGPLCVVCKKKEEKKDVEVCEKCGRGYHRDCTQGNFGANGVWYCRRCSCQNGIKNNQNNETWGAVKTCKSQLSYDLDSLRWDPYHRKNMENIYCYCGTSGNWVEQMLQCSRCQQWFHDKCLQNSSYPLFSGDRFYIFVCSMCNHGKEFLRRLEMNWTDLIHLLLFNLTFYNRPNKYFDLQTVLTPYFMELHRILQLPDYMNGLAATAIQQKFLIVLQSNENRFRQSSIDAKAWGLCQNKPPDAPFVILPNDKKAISESYISAIWADTKLPLGFVVRGMEKSSCSKSEWYKRIQGKQFVASLASSRCFNEFPDGRFKDHFDEDDEIPVKFIIEKDKIGNFSGCKTVETPTTSSTPHGSRASSETTKIATDSNENSRDAFDDTSRDSLIVPPKPPQNTQKRRLRKRSAPNLTGPPLKKLKTEEKAPSPEDSSNDDDTSSRSTLDLIFPPPKDFQGSNNPFNPVYVPQPPSVLPLSKHRDTDKDSLENKKGSGKLRKIKGASKPPPENSKIRIVRTIRRRLSAKDIIIGPNQEVKYKKKSKHRNEDVEIISTTTIGSNVTTTFLPTRTEFKDWNATPNTKLALFNSSATSSATQPSTLKRSGSFKDKDRHSTGSSSGYSSIAGSSHTGYSSLPNSPNAKEKASLIDTYFENSHRLKNGEKFVVRGRRTKPDGSKQYLIEWSGKNKLQLF
ncbi:polycomb protein Pcl [Culicoides brevitarsis]|uniref:polycomb protein Pcl n=1 Tax=Culicoides brevitarsis TaxID=469753 RepID=UPI00307B392D